jgi:lipooligosaccharide transport system permease protein
MSLDGALRVIEREARIYRRLWRGNAFSTFVGPSLYLGAMGLGLGGLVDANNTSVDGLSYLQFVAPGLLAATSLQMAAGDSMWPVMAGTKWIRHYHAMVAAPLEAADVMLGHLGWMAIRLSVAGAAFLLVAAVLGALASPLAILALPAAVLTGLAFAAPLTAFAATQETDHKFALVMRFFVLPLFLFSGTFFPISQLPTWMQVVAWASPLWHGVVLCRSATTGMLPDGGWLGIVVHLTVLVAFITAGVAWGRRTFAERLVS